MSTLITSLLTLLKSDRLKQCTFIIIKINVDSKGIDECILKNNKVIKKSFVMIETKTKSY